MGRKKNYNANSRGKLERLNKYQMVWTSRQIYTARDEEWHFIMTSQDKLLHSSNRVLLLLLLLLLQSLQSCPTLCDPIDGSPPGFPVPGILQARTLEWVAISFSNAWKWKVKVKPLGHVRLCVTPWTVAYQAPLSMGFSRQEYWSGVPLLLSNKKEQTADTCNKVNESQKHYIILRERHLAEKSIHCTILFIWISKTCNINIRWKKT